MPYVSFVFICLVWGASFILMDRATHALGPVAIAVCRLLSGSTVLGLSWLFIGRRIKLSKSDLGHILVVAILANALPFVVQPLVMAKAGEHAYFGMMVALVPLATILISVPMLGIWPTRRQLVGVLGGLICMGGVVYDGSQRGLSANLLALALTVPITYAMGNTYIKWKLDHLPPLALTGLFLGVAGLILLPFFLLPASIATSLGLDGPAAPHDWPLAIASLAVLGVLGTGITILMFIHLIKNQGPLFAGMVTYVIPVVALAWGQYDSEQLTPLQIVAIAGVLGCVALVQWGAAQRHQNVPDPLLD